MAEVRRNLPPGVIVATLIGTGSVLTLALLFEQWRLLYWLPIYLLLQLLTALLLRDLARRTLPPRTLYRVMIGVFGSAGVVWGGLALFVAPGPNSLTTLLFLTTVISVHCAGTFPLTGASLPLYCIFMLPSLAPLTAVFFLRADSLSVAMGIIVVLLIGCMLLFASRAQAAGQEKMRLQFANDELVARLREESRLLAKARWAAEEASRDKSRFLAAASHDLRQPMHALGLFLEALGRTSLDVDQRSILDKLKLVSRSANGLLGGLLDFSRLDAGVVVPALRSFALQAVMHKLEQELAPMAESRGLVYRSRDTSLAVHSDPVLVERILRNLINNAINYTERGGVLVACRRRGDRVWVEIRDTGVGIAPEYQQAVFREFFQIGNRERDRRKGLGLGLAIVTGLCRALNADLSMVSRPGRGSLFRLALPLAAAAVVENPMPAIQRQFLVPISVLVVDDDPEVREAMRVLLASWGCHCQVAESAVDALRLGLPAPNLLVVDYRLRGGETGAEAIDVLRQSYGEDVPAIVITGDTAPDRLREVQRVGSALLHKPLEADALYRVMVQLVGERADGVAGAG
ncbi:response regulator [Microbulbifer sp. SH-1]|uniref:ATP-binding response regulator n=1 Tax=Microbulbifer sp. SH-1 TaxID=2681547 RepID=UPI001409832D|nr:hybrid sensor histidine kinase/response regulator [Microbulbifer sp. SH-1]QIL91649.1 response regulator [Microbulbifer sp. SH-1]